MAINVEDFADYIGADIEEHSVALTRALSVASTLVALELVNQYRVMEEDVKDQVVLDVAYAVYRRADNNAGTGQYEDTSAIRTPNDPLQQVRPILRKYVMGVAQ